MNDSPTTTTARSEETTATPSENETSTPAEDGPRYRNEALVGIAAVLAIVIAFLGVRYMRGKTIFGNEYSLQADFESADGLTEGAAVTVSGLKVGTVGDIGLAKGGRNVQANLRIDKDVQVPKGSVAKISGVPALGNISVAINLGPSAGPPLSDGATLPTNSEGPLEGFSEQMRPLAGRLDSTLAHAGGAFQKTEHFLNGSQGELRATLQSLRGASSAAETLLREQRGQLRGAAANIEELTAHLSRLTDDFSKYVDDGGGDSLAATVRSAHHTLRETRMAARSLRQSTDELNMLLRNVNQGRGTLGKLARDPSLYNHLDSTTLRLNRMLVDVKQHPARYLKELRLVDLF